MTLEPRWLLLLGQMPRRPDYLRVKNAAYALPRSEGRNEDLQLGMREIVAGGGEAMLGLFSRARDADYQELGKEVRALGKRIPKRGKLREEVRRQLEADVWRLGRRLEEVAAIDFCHASGRETVSGLLDELKRRLTTAPAASVLAPKAQEFSERTWVTRQGIHVDRMASAWLIRRFIDPAAKFKWVPPKGYTPKSGALRFDMFDGEFTHVGDRCTLGR